MSKHWVEIFAAPETLVRSYLAAEVTTKSLQKTVITDFHLQQTTRWAQWHPRDQIPVTEMPLKGLEATMSLGQSWSENHGKLQGICVRREPLFLVLVFTGKSKTSVPHVQSWSPVKILKVSVLSFPLQDCPLESMGPVLVTPLRNSALCRDISPVMEY